MMGVGIFYMGIFMKKVNVWSFGFFILGIFSFAVWNQFFYVNIPKDGSVRKIASQSTGQQVVIDDFTNRILEIDSTEDIDRVISHISKVSKEYPKFVGVQLFASFAEALPQFKGIAWKLRGLVEKTDIAHTYILSQLRFLYFSSYMYGPHLKALFHYLTDPPKNGSKFESLAELQNALYFKIRPQLSSLLQKAERSLGLEPELHNFTFDRRIFTGDSPGKRFFDPSEANREFIKPYMSYIISCMARAIAAIDYLYIYNIDDLPNIMRAVLKKSAINQLKSRFQFGGTSSRRRVGFNSTRINKESVKSLPQVISRKEVFEIIERRKFSDFLTFASDRVSREKANEVLAESYQMVQKAAEHDLKGYVCSISYVSMMMNGEYISSDYSCDWDFMEKEGFTEEEYFVVGGKNFLIDPNQLLINHKQKFHELRDRYRIYLENENNSGVYIVSDVTGEPIRINAHAVFKVFDDLKVFIPETYSNEMVYNGKTLARGYGSHNKNGKWSWNFDYGRPLSWSSEAITFGGLFPDMTNSNVYDLMYTIRLTQSLRPFSNLFTTVP